MSYVERQRVLGRACCGAFALSPCGLCQAQPAATESTPDRTVHLTLDAPPAESAAAEAPGPGWRVEYNSWFWVMGVEGDIGARGRTSDVSADFGDILDASDSVLAFAGRLEVGRGRWGAFVDGMYSDLGADDQSGRLGLASVDVTFEMLLIDFGLTYRLGEWAPAGDAADNRRNATVDLYGGGRYTKVEIEVDGDNFDARSDSERV